MSDTPQIRSVLQFTAGKKRGLLSQVIAIENGVIKCLSREVDSDRGHFFNVEPGDTFSLIGFAALGPKSDQTGAPSPAPLPPPLNPQELLEPLPADVKAVPMNDALLPNAPPPLPDPVPPLKPEPVKRKPRSKPQMAIYQKREAIVENALGAKTTVTIAVREGRPINRYIGGAIMQAMKTLPNIKPFKVKWK